VARFCPLRSVIAVPCVTYAYDKTLPGFQCAPTRIDRTRSVVPIAVVILLPSLFSVRDPGAPEARMLSPGEVFGPSYSCDVPAKFLISLLTLCATPKDSPIEAASSNPSPQVAVIIACCANF
jgi:hypothetical protein